MSALRVLLVDDEQEFVATLAERLALRGVAAEWVTSGEAALERAAGCGYDLAVLDVKMPRLGGIALKKLLQQRCPQMRFIFMTGHGSEQEFEAGANEAGADYYLVKPVHIEDLVRKMNEVMAGEPLRR